MQCIFSVIQVSIISGYFVYFDLLAFKKTCLGQLCDRGFLFFLLKCGPLKIVCLCASSCSFHKENITNNLRIIIQLSHSTVALFIYYEGDIIIQIRYLLILLVSIYSSKLMCWFLSFTLYHVYSSVSRENIESRHSLR